MPRSVPEVSPPRVLAFVGLGANLGEAEKCIAWALEALGATEGVDLVGRSSLYKSAPIDASGPDFINAAVALCVSLSPVELLHCLHALEDEAGRRRTYRNAPRELDLDLLAYGDLSLNTPELTLPHPRLHQRAFVLLPLLELAPGLCLPGLGALEDYLPAVASQEIRRMEPPTPG